MIPILYESNETGFNTNGLGRLRDCISCVVTEERNGIYECDFEYPVDGAHFEDIRIGRIIGVEHDDTDDIQPFDIMSHERPIEGVVTFHCIHISYRLSKMTVSRSYISSLANAFYAIKFFATPSWNPFSFYTDKDSTGYVAAFDGLPRTARSLLGGREGSILDTYGGEYEWDKWTVRLLSARGAYRDLTVRYGVNMTDYNEEVDNSETYQSVIPYWTDGTDKVIGDQQTGPVKTITGRDDTVPLDLSDKFEVTDGNIPTKEQVEAMARTFLENGANALPVQRISVSFIRLQDAGEFEQFKDLFQCRLCDSIKVIFPGLGSEYFKIVKTVWNVLEDRYDSMELGALQTTLSEALGIGSGGGLSGGGGGSIPIGAILAYGGMTVPSGWLICDGNAVSRTEYSELFAAIGTTYGAGDGSTTFNLPDLKGRVAVGAGNSGTTGATNHTLGQKSGEETHTLTTNEMPSHLHGIRGEYGATGSGALPPGGQYYQLTGNQSYGFQTNASETVGGGAAHNNMQPYVVTNYIIRAKN